MPLEILMFISGALLLMCVFANRVSDTFGIPSLLFFLAVGMLAGSDGIGKIDFYDSKLASNIGTIALSFILFAGGVDTRWSEVRPLLFRGGLLSTVGVSLTALFLFLCSYFFLNIDLSLALLLSVIVSSTDAPAVFAIMRSQKRDLKPKLKPLLEFESGSNDPMAVLLSMGAISMLSDHVFNIVSVGHNLIWQIFMGTVMGFLAGKAAVYILSRWHLIYNGLYPVFGVGLVLLTFSLTQFLKGNGFLAVYLCGIYLGNNPFLYRRQFIRFQDSLSWIMQIGMFIILGLLVNPSELWDVASISFACALCLMFIARPLAVFACLYKSDFTKNEKIFISWAGLKGSVPIILATYPLMINYPNAQFLFNLIFFLVIISVLFQGKTLALLAKYLKLYEDDEKPEPEKPAPQPIKKNKPKKQKG